MPRSRKLRFVQGHPIVSAFILDRIPFLSIEAVVLPIEGLEAIKLSDFQGMDPKSAIFNYSGNHKIEFKVLLISL